MIRALVVAILLLAASPVLACDALVLAFEPGTTDPMAWRLGDAVVVRESGFVWGDRERLPKFYHIIITDATKAQCQNFLERVLDADGNVTKLRKVRLAYTSLPAGVKTTLNTTGTISVTKAQALAYFASVQ